MAIGDKKPVVMEADRAVAGGVATLGADGKLLDAQIPGLGKLGAAPAPLSANIEVYVATTGSDTTGDGSSANPYATIQHALDTIPKNLGGCSAWIGVASGNYAGFEITGFFNGFVGIVGTEDYAVNIGNNGVYVGKCSAAVLLKYLHITGTRVGYGVYTDNTQSVELNYVQIDGTASVGGIMAKNTSTLVLFGVAVSDKTWHALTCFGSTAFVNNLSGSNNQVGILAGNSNTGIPGLVVCGGVTLTATTLYSKAAGGAIISNGALV